MAADNNRCASLGQALWEKHGHERYYRRGAHTLCECCGGFPAIVTVTGPNTAECPYCGEVPAGEYFKNMIYRDDGEQ